MFQVRIHGRAGQGAVTAAELLIGFDACFAAIGAQLASGTGSRLNPEVA
jgi:Pyruvate/2-oxoacid:ferredoxin oxidoreductase gamma subunit